MTAPPSSSRTLPPTLGPFRLITQRGRGGFAPVWHAEEVYDGRKLRDVAIKLFFLPEAIPPDSAEAARWRDSVIAEARALCRVEHPNVVRFYALQRDDAHGIVGLVMEYVAGSSLSVVLRRQGPFKEQDVLAVGIDVAWALAAVHDAGLVHRDVKPENILQTESGYKLIDFGIVVDAPPARGEGGPREPPQPPPIIGTPGYVAPEYIERRALPSPAGDLYALGVTLFRLATGAMPGAVPSAAPASSGLLALIALLLNRNPHERPPHADWVARELERLHTRLPSGSAKGLSLAPPGASKLPALASVLRLERRVLAPLAPLFDAVRRAAQGDGGSDVGAVLGELALGVLRYAFALGMAILAAASPAQLSGALAEELRSAARPTHASWWSLLRAIHEDIAEVDPPSARLFAFAREASLADQLSALLRHDNPTTAPEAWARWLIALLEGAAELLAVPIGAPGMLDPMLATETSLAVGDDSDTPPATLTIPYAMIGARAVCLSPWLPQAGRYLPEAPAAPGRPWRATDPASGERHDDLCLDDAVRGLLGADATLEDIPRELCPHPPLIGRAEPLAVIGRAAREALQGNVRLVLLTGPLGIGRTRLLDAAIEQASVAPPRVIRAPCSPERKSPLRPLLAGLEALPDGGAGAFQRLLGAIERARMPAVLPGEGAEAIEAVEATLLQAAAEAPVLLAIDDVQWADTQTLKLLQLLVERTDRGSKAKLLICAAARDEPSAVAPLRAFFGEVRGRTRPGVKHLALGPLTAEQAAALAQAVGPLDIALERAVVRGSGRVPFFLVNALLTWRETGAIAWQNGSFCAVDERLLGEGVPGVADLVEARLASYFAPSSPMFRATLRALAAIALHGGGLPLETILHVGRAEEPLEDALEALVTAGVLVASGERQEYGFAQEMVRQAVLNLVRRRPWFYRLHRALLDAVAGSPDAATAAAFLATGYEKIGDRDKARAWLGRAMESAIHVGLFEEAAAFGGRLAALAEDPTARAQVELAIVRALVQGRQINEAKARLERLDASMDELTGRDARVDLEIRIRKLEVARGRHEKTEDPGLIEAADALSDLALRCEARIALAGVSPEKEDAMALIDEAVELADLCGPSHPLAFAARVLRVELIYATSRDVPKAERDLRRALAIARATGSIWQQIHIEGDLAVIEAEQGSVATAIERLRRLAGQAEARGMRGQLRTLLHNLSTCLMREDRAAEAAEVAQRTADLAAEAGDPVVRGLALSLRAYALFCTGDLDAGLVSASEAERLQRDRDDAMRAQTLLRRAAILDALGREGEALEDARAAQEAAERHGQRGFFVTAALWEKLCLAREGEAPAEEVREALAAAKASGAGQRALTRRLIEQAEAWLASLTAPTLV